MKPHEVEELEKLREEQQPKPTPRPQLEIPLPDVVQYPQSEPERADNERPIKIQLY